MTTDTILYLLIFLVVLETAIERILEFANLRTWTPTVPDSIRQLVDPDKYAKSRDYAREKGRIGLWSSLLSLSFTVILLATGAFGWLEHYIRTHWIDHPYWTVLLFFGLFALVSHLISLPFSLYNTFVIEEKYGFNKMTPTLFVQDELKGLVLGALIGGALLSAFIWLYHYFGNTFWIYAWLFFMAIVVFMQAFATTLIFPLFNKLSPLEEGSLRTAIFSYAKQVQFPLKKILVMDGSKRSTKANAFFSGLGGQKNIVLYDTLLQKHSEEEVVAVLAHEVGHYKRKHTLQTLLFSSITMLLTFYLLHLFIDFPGLSLALGGDGQSLALGLVAFSILYSPISLITGLAMNILSRKNEFEADAYAAETYDAQPLSTALKQLSLDHLSNLQPHPAYVFFNYSHPPVLQRIKAMGVEV